MVAGCAGACVFQPGWEPRLKGPRAQPRPGCLLPLQPGDGTTARPAAAGSGRWAAAHLHMRLAALRGLPRGCLGAPSCDARTLGRSGVAGPGDFDRVAPTRLPLASRSGGSAGACSSPGSRSWSLFGFLRAPPSRLHASSTSSTKQRPVIAAGPLPGTGDGRRCNSSVEISTDPIPGPADATPVCSRCSRGGGDPTKYLHLAWSW